MFIIKMWKRFTYRSGRKTLSQHDFRELPFSERQQWIGQ